MKARKDNWVESRRVKPKSNEPVWIIVTIQMHAKVVPASYRVTDDEDVPEGFFWELPNVIFVYGHRFWQPRFDAQPEPPSPYL